ncbi:hypothetical protein NLC35_02485 [Candidatus Aminicenantes bacterium AC-334-K16]|nr:hypothetical protein [Candidatus Aminicenantes bacterium AC-334-K16]
MKLITKSEKKWLLGLTILLILNIIVFQVLAQGKRRAYFRHLETLEKGKTDLEKLEITFEQLRDEWLRWRRAKEDINFLNKYFYSDKSGFEKLRSDLNLLFQAAGGEVSNVRYDYARYDDTGTKKVKVSFQLSTSYYSFKKFISAVETLSKFLMIEDLRFSEIDSGTGRLKANFVLAAYFRK